MLVKKNKKSKKEKISKKDVKRAVEKLPGLIVEQVRLAENEPQAESLMVEQAQEQVETQPEERRSANRARMRHNPSQTRWLWTGVVIFCLVIFSMWGWNMYVMIGDATQTNGPTTWMPNTVTDDLRAVWEEVGAEDDELDGKETVKEKIKTNLKDLIAQVKNLPTAIATSTTPTTTLESATVSL